MKRKAEGIALLSLYNDDDEEEEEEEEEEEARLDGLDSTAANTVDEALNAEAEVIEEDATPAASTVQEPQREASAVASPEENLGNDFLPSPPTSKCSDELQDRFAWFLSLKKEGRSFNEDLRNSKGYRNPDFLHRAVIHQGVDQIGSCFRKEIFDPHGYDPEDFYDVLDLQQKREFERREQERKQNQRIEFVRVNTIANAAKLMQQKGGLVNAVAAAGGGGVASLNEAGHPKSEGRVKKSKWDKVEPDVRTPFSAQNVLAVAAAQATLISQNLSKCNESGASEENR